MNSIDFLREVLQQNNNEIKFSSPIIIKSSPHNFAAKVTGILLFDNDVCYELKDNNELKFLVNADEMIINTICQRIRLLKHQNLI